MANRVHAARLCYGDANVIRDDKLKLVTGMVCSYSNKKKKTMKHAELHIRGLQQSVGEATLLYGNRIGILVGKEN